MTLSDEEYDDLVTAAAYGDEITAEQQAVLDDDPVRWRRSLVALLEDIRADISAANAQIHRLKTEKKKGWFNLLAEASELRAGLVQDQVAAQQALSRVKATIGGPVTRPNDALRGLAEAIERFVPPLIAAGVINGVPFQRAIEEARDKQRRALIDGIVGEG